MYSKKEAPTNEDPNAEVFVVMECTSCHVVDFRKEERLLRSGNPKCPYCGGLVREAESI